MWKKIYSKLKEKGLAPYAPGQHKGVCKKRYCVVREGTQMPSFRSRQVGRQIVDVIVFVPIGSYIQVAPYVGEIKAALSELPFLQKTGGETPTITDDSVEAYTTSVQYQIMKRLEG